MAEPPAKKAKTEDGEAQAEEKKEGDVEMEPQELEEDFKKDTRPKLGQSVCFHVQDTTMNVMQSTYGNMLLTLTDGGMQFLVAGARASVGVKAGRYYFEAKILEYVAPMDDVSIRSRVPQPRSYVRIGVAKPGSSLFLGETEDSVCFDSEGSFCYNKKKEPAGEKFGRDITIGLLLNLDDSSANASTVSFFKNGTRASKPIPLPEGFAGKALFPAFTYRNVTLRYNFGPKPEEPLPFTCRMMSDIAKADAVQAANPSPKDGKYEVMFPVCLPDEGTFDWVDLFLEKNPHYTELSDRMILAWLEKSNVVRAKGYGTRTSNDKPEMGYGIPHIDDGSIRKVLYSVAPSQQRSYIIMEVKGSLITEDRSLLLSHFKDQPQFKRVAHVLVGGDPPQEFKKYTQKRILKGKQEASDAEFHAKKAEEKRKKMMEKRQKELEKQRKAAEKAKKKAEEEKKKKAEEEKKKKEAEEKGEEYVPAEDATMEAEEEEDKEEEEEEEAEEKEEDPPKVELTPEEMSMSFRKSGAPDLTPYVMSLFFTKFTLPNQAEGFDDVKYEWLKTQQKCEEYVRSWIVERKVTTRMEEIAPSAWFQAKWKDWQKVLQLWHAKQNEFKAMLAKKAAEKNQKAALKAKKEAEEAAKKRAAELKKEQGGAEEGKEEETKETDEPPEKEPEEEPRVDFDKLDVFGVEDVLNVGAGEPLFSNFAFEDWTMMTLRFELHLLSHSFRKDANDTERKGIYHEHLGFYYTKYYKKSLNTKFFGVDTVKELVELIRDTIVLNPKSQVLEPQLPEDMESLGIFAMLTEECRRDRQRRVDMGQESARLKLSAPGSSLLSAGGAKGGPVGPGQVPKAMQAGQVQSGVGGVTPASQVRPQGLAAVVPRPVSMGGWPMPGVVRPGFQPAGWRPAGW